MATPVYTTGDKGYVSVDGTILNITKWNLEPKAEVHETTNTGDAGSESFLGGIEGATGSFQANWDAANSPLTTPPNLIQGRKARLKLYIGDPANAKYWECDAIFSSQPITSGVKGLVQYTQNFTKTGAWITRPT